MPQTILRFTAIICVLPAPARPPVHMGGTFNFPPLFCRVRCHVQDTDTLRGWAAPPPLYTPVHTPLKAYAFIPNPAALEGFVEACYVRQLTGFDSILGPFRTHYTQRHKLKRAACCDRVL